MRTHHATCPLGRRHRTSTRQPTRPSRCLWASSSGAAGAAIYGAAAAPATAAAAASLLLLLLQLLLPTQFAQSQSSSSLGSTSNDPSFGILECAGAQASGPAKRATHRTTLPSAMTIIATWWDTSHATTTPLSDLKWRAHTQLSYSNPTISACAPHGSLNGPASSHAAPTQ